MRTPMVYITLIRFACCLIADVNVSEDFQSIFAVNTFGPYYLSRALVRSWLGLPVSVNSVSDPIDVANAKNVNLKKQILFVSSISALVAMNPQRQTAYNASKGAVTMLAKVRPISIAWGDVC